MDLLVHQTTTLHGTCTPPGSKSQTIRALFIAALAKGKSIIENALDSDDTGACIEVLENLGASIAVTPTSNGLTIMVESDGVPFRPRKEKFDTKDSGITTRFLLPILGLAEQTTRPFIVTCGEQMQARPIRGLIDALNTLGTNISTQSEENVWPLKVANALEGGSASVDGTTSQFLSALLIALPCALRDSCVTVEHLNERPYAQMTARWLTEQGIEYGWETIDGHEKITIRGKQKYRPFTKVIPVDLSSASYAIAAGVVTEGEVRITPFDPGDAQGDKALIGILQSMGADITFEGQTLIVRGGMELQGKEIDCNDIPDLIPTLAVIGTHATGLTRLYNASHARLKETDRIQAMYTELRKLGAHIKQSDDGLIITQSKLKGATVHGHSDHRTIMALAVAGLIAEGTTRIHGAEGISKTYPIFDSHMRALGASIQRI